MSDEVERTLCQLPQVHVFRIPTRKSAEGYRASDWPKEPTWTGKLKIVAKARTAAIILMDEKNQVFAVCPVTDDGAVERTLDSGRYFVLRIKNAQDRHAFIGIAFNERNDAFDFNVALSEFKSECEREDEAAKMGDTAVGPMKDMSLKDGEKIKIGINFKKKTKPEGNGTAANQPARGLGALKPPPRDSAASTFAAPSSSASSSAAPLPSTSSSDPFGSDPFGSSSAVDTVFRSSTSASADPFASASFGAFAPTPQGNSSVAAQSQSRGDTNNTNISLLDL